MSTITITRLFNGFRNVCDPLVVGDHESDGDAAATVYTLPAGYVVRDDMIIDRAGYLVEPMLVDGAPTLVSLRGPCADVRLVEAA